MSAKSEHHHLEGSAIGVFVASISRSKAPLHSTPLRCQLAPQTTSTMEEKNEAISFRCPPLLTPLTFKARPLLSTRRLHAPPPPNRGGAAAYSSKLRHGSVSLNPPITLDPFLPCLTSSIKSIFVPSFPSHEPVKMCVPKKCRII